MGSNNDALAEIKAGFFAECEELLESLQEGLCALSVDAPDPETLNTVFRAVHSIKGGAGAFELRAITEFTHAFETALDHFRQNPTAQISSVTKTLLTAADLLSDLLKAEAEGEPDCKIDTHQTLEALKNIQSDEVCPPVQFKPIAAQISLEELAPEPLIDLYFEPSAELFTTGNEPLFLLHSLADIADCETKCLMDSLPPFAELDPEASYLKWAVKIKTQRPIEEIKEVFDFAEGLCKLEFKGGNATVPTPVVTTTETVEAPKQTQNTAKSTVRVDLERIDKLVNLVGELVINQSMLNQNVAEAGIAPNSLVMVGLEDFMQLASEIQDCVMMIRAQPVKSLFQRMGRVVREAASSTGKEVRFVTQGDETEIDKTVLEHLTEPLTHILRNAVDHGLEAPDVRLAAHKPDTGTITLSAAHRSGRVNIEVSDDGAGLDFERINQNAVERGMIATDAVLSDAEKINLLFQPGFSTVENVSEMSGRGVGMDVVKTSIQGLGGHILMTSIPGEGTKLSASLPLTLSVVDGMIIQIAEQTMIVPLGTVSETLILHDNALKFIKNGQPILQVHGKPVRLFDLGAALHLRQGLQDYSNKVALIFRVNEIEDVALVVDDIIDQRQVVIKGLKHSFGELPGISAATILGDGQVALILDPFDLILAEDLDHTPFSQAS